MKFTFNLGALRVKDIYLNSVSDYCYYREKKEKKLYILVP